MCKYCSKKAGYKLTSNWGMLGSYYISVCNNCGYPTPSEIALTYQYYAQVAFFSSSGPRVSFSHVTEQDLRRVLRERVPEYSPILHGLRTTRLYVDEGWSNV